MGVRQVGFASTAKILEASRRGADPKALVDALMDEAKRRHPHALAVSIDRQADGFAINIIERL